jgi:hypothetical protein
MAWGTGGFKSCDSLLTKVENDDPLLKELVILPIKTFGSPELERLSDILSSGKNTHLTSIFASGHAVTPDALYKLSQAMASPGGKHIKCLSIGDEQMGDEGVEALCRGLAHVNGGFLEWLDLSSKNLTSTSSLCIYIVIRLVMKVLFILCNKSWERQHLPVFLH